jgi:hypothetical protein
MITIQEDNCTVMYSENIPYTRIDISGLLQTEPLIERLSDSKLFDLLQENHVQNVLLNMSQAWRVGTEDLDWVEKTWFHQLSGVGIRKVSIVTVGQVHDMLINIFQGMAESADKIGVEVRFFNDDQFYNGWDAVSWL